MWIPENMQGLNRRSLKYVEVVQLYLVNVVPMHAAVKRREHQPQVDVVHQARTLRVNQELLEEVLNHLSQLLGELEDILCGNKGNL